MGLAPRLADAFSDVIRGVPGTGVAVLIAGQNVRRMLAMAQRAYLLENGRVSAEDTGSALLASRTLRRALLET
jgi:branched-chain amino acid transport system ATP-binding protein